MRLGDESVARKSMRSPPVLTLLGKSVMENGLKAQVRDKQ